jgi:hypothetical protein
MICYMDRTYCISPNCVNACGRKLTDAVRVAAKAAGLPISTLFAGSMATKTRSG